MLISLNMKKGWWICRNSTVVVVVAFVFVLISPLHEIQVTRTTNFRVACIFILNNIWSVQQPFLLGLFFHGPQTVPLNSNFSPTNYDPTIIIIIIQQPLLHHYHTCSFDKHGHLLLHGLYFQSTYFSLSLHVMCTLYGIGIELILIITFLGGDRPPQ